MKLLRIIDKTTFKFIFVGGLNTIVGASIMFISYNLMGLTYWISSALNYILGSIFSFFMNKYFTFNKKSKTKTQILLFICNIVICYIIAYGIAKPVINTLLINHTLSIRENISMFVGMIFFTGLNYFGQRYIVFKY